jgi:N-acetylmuramoyl-L-alanine amidase
MKTKRYFFIAVWSILGPFAALAAPIVNVSVEDTHEIITLRLSETEPNKVFTLAAPDRLVVDVPSLSLDIDARKTVSLGKTYKGALLKNVRYGAFNHDTSRFVFDLTRPVEVLRSEPGSGTLTIELEGKGTVAGKRASKKSRRPLIVIDPGHGGVDPGAIAGDEKEKTIVLQYAKVLQDKLLKRGRYDVALTRETDTFIPLRKRFEIARKAGADLFISLHADSAPEDVRGLSVYTVSEKASDEEAEALAARENKSDVLAGVDLSEERQDVAGILISLAQRETNNRSAMLADMLVVALSQRVRMVERSHRFAGFAVLKAPDIPSVLIELGFLSNATDRKLLKSKDYRNKLTEGIVAGIDAYFKRQKKMEAQ